VWVKGSGRKPKWLNDFTRKEGLKLEDLEVKPEKEEPRAEELQAEEKAEEQPAEEQKSEEPAKETETAGRTSASLYGNYGHRS
jgi:hypothetical protein